MGRGELLRAIPSRPGSAEECWQVLEDSVGGCKSKPWSRNELHVCPCKLTQGFHAIAHIFWAHTEPVKPPPALTDPSRAEQTSTDTSRASPVSQGGPADSLGSYLRDLRWAWSRLSLPLAQPLVLVGSLTTQLLSFSGRLSSAGYGRQLSVPLLGQEVTKSHQELSPRPGESPFPFAGRSCAAVKESCRFLSALRWEVLPRALECPVPKPSCTPAQACHAH